MAENKDTKAVEELKDTILPSLRKKARQRQEAAYNENSQLPLWPDSVRALPNGILRSALFGAIRKGGRRFCQSEVFPSPKGIDICYTGERLDQGDLTVYETVLHIAREQKLGEECRFTSYAMLKLMGKTDTGKNRDILHDRIVRLVSGAVELHQGSFFYVGSLVNDASKDKSTQEWVLTLNPRLRALYEQGQFTRFEHSIRRELDGKPLAQWLYGFLSSHAEPFPIKLSTLQSLCGSEIALKSDFAKKVKKACEALKEANLNHGKNFEYKVTSDMLHTLKRW